MPDVTLFDAETGRIIRQCTVSAADISLQNRRPVTYPDGSVGVEPDPSIIVIEGAYDSRYSYWRDNEVVDRPKLAITTSSIHGEDNLVCNHLPAGTVVQIREGDNYEAVTVDDGSLVYRTDFPGPVAFTITPPFPWQVERIEVVVA